MWIAQNIQDIYMRLLLIDGQGNCSAMDDDPPVAMRYTELWCSRSVAMAPWPRCVHVSFYMSDLIGGRQMARRGVYARAEAVHFLEEAGRWRRQCIEVLIRAKPQGELYNAVTAVVKLSTAWPRSWPAIGSASTRSARGRLGRTCRP